jgi:hypothetical protein
MTRRALTLWSAAAALTLTVSPAWARQAKERPESRPSNGESTGTAVSRPSGSSGSSAGSASSGGSSSSSGGGSSASMPAGGGGDSSYGRGSYRTPSAPERRAERRDRAVERDNTFRSVDGGRSTSSSVNSGNAQGAERRAVPAYSRPRDGRQPVGEAVARTGRIPNRGNGGIDGGYYRGYYDPYYGGYYNPYYGFGYGNYGYGRIFPGYGFGLGYFYDPFGYGYGYESPYDEYGYGGYGSSYSSSYGRSRGTGQLRLKVKPEHGQVYVDGYYVGEVDNFDGVFQRMPIEAGAHRVEIRAAGFQSVTFDVMVVPGETVTYKGQLRPIR